MTPEEKKNMLDKVATAADDAAQKTAAAAKTATGWKKWVFILLTLILAGVAVFLETGCEQMQNITPAQVQQVGGAVHDLYHLAHPDKPCVLILPVDDIDK